MGLILDSSVLIAAERAGKNARAALIDIAQQAAGEDVAISVVTVAELAHGVERAATQEQQSMRREFLRELLSAVPVHAVSIPLALLAGQIDGRRAAQGVRFAMPDLLIGATALDISYRVATRNLRHFNKIPGL